MGEEVNTVIRWLLRITSGKKTYAVAAAGVAYAVLSWYFGAIDQKAAVEMALGFLGLGSLRAGVSKSGFPQDPTKGGD